MAIVLAASPALAGKPKKKDLPTKDLVELAVGCMQQTLADGTVTQPWAGKRCSCLVDEARKVSLAGKAARVPPAKVEATCRAYADKMATAGKATRSPFSTGLKYTTDQLAGGYLGCLGAAEDPSWTHGVELARRYCLCLTEAMHVKNLTMDRDPHPCDAMLPR